MTGLTGVGGGPSAAMTLQGANASSTIVSLGRTLNRVAPSFLWRWRGAKLAQCFQDPFSPARTDLSLFRIVGPEEDVAVILLRRRHELPNFLLASLADFQDRHLDALTLALVRF